MKYVHAVLLFVALGFGASHPAGAETRLFASGELSGRSGHHASGTVQLLQSGQGLTVQLADNFRFDGAPAPRLGFGRDGFDRNSRFADLKNDSGHQQYTVTVRPGQYNEFWLWCDKFDVPIGYAKLTPIEHAKK